MEQLLFELYHEIQTSPSPGQTRRTFVCPFNGCFWNLPYHLELIDDHYQTHHGIVNNMMTHTDNHYCSVCGHIPLRLFVSETERSLYWKHHQQTHVHSSNPSEDSDDNDDIHVLLTSEIDYDISAFETLFICDSSDDGVVYNPEPCEDVLQPIQTEPIIDSVFRASILLEPMCPNGRYCLDHTSCQYNHNMYLLPVVIPGSIKPSSLCPFEDPFLNTMCSRNACPYDHATRERKHIINDTK